jgi:uncharacterized protein (TIRG00374 family)
MATDGEQPDGRAPIEAAAPTHATDQPEQLPSGTVTRGRVVASLLFVVGVVVFMYFGLPKLVGFGDTIERLREGNAWWLGAAAVLEMLSFGGYVALFRAVFIQEVSRITWRASYEITMAGLAATRLFAAAGAGGIALTAWALRRSGMERRLVASRMVAFMALLYGVYMASLVIDGLGLYFGFWPGPAPFAITVVPAIFGGAVIVLFLAISALPDDFERFVARRSSGHGWRGRIEQRLATVPSAAATGVRTGLRLLRTRNPGLLGAVAWWGFDIATLWACFHAFGASPPKGVIVMAYFVGWIANTLPLPGGIGGVEGGMIGAFTAFDVSVQSAVVAVLAYRAFSFWLPTLPGGVAYVQLRRTVNRWRSSGTATAQTPVAPAG